MASPARHHRHVLADYLALERRSPDKHEFLEGQILVMAGGSPRHNYLSARLQHLLAARLVGGPCFPLSSDQRLATADGLYTYADGSVFCGRVDVGPEQTATNPLVVFEVLSASTRDYDRGDKLERYKRMPSVQHVVLVEQHTVDVEVWTRGPEGWTRRVYTERSDTVRLTSPAVELPVAEIYEGSDRLPA